MAGTASVGQCHETPAQAASLWCASIQAGTSAGVLTCQSVSSLVPAADGSLTFKWQRRLTAPDGTTSSSQVSGQVLQGCESFDFAYYEPALTAFTGAMVAILCARWLYRFFMADKEVV